jgi:hypothetical protein
VQGAYLGGVRPATKKALREALAADPDGVYLEATSLFGDEYDGPATGLPVGRTAYLVGPDPYRKRVWYAALTRKKDGTLSLK